MYGKFLFLGHKALHMSVTARVEYETCKELGGRETYQKVVDSVLDHAKFCPAFQTVLC